MDLTEKIYNRDLGEILEKEISNAMKYTQVFVEKIDSAHEENKKFFGAVKKDYQEKDYSFLADFIWMETGKEKNDYFICIGNYKPFDNFWKERIGIKIKKEDKIYFAYSNNDISLNIINCPWLAFDNFKPRDLFTLGLFYLMRSSENITYTPPQSFIERTNNKDKENIILFLKTIPTLIKEGKVI